MAWKDTRTGARAKKREREETGKTGTGPCCNKLGAHDGKLGQTMCVAWTDARTGTRARKREREETGKNGYGGRVAKNWARTMENRGKPCAWNGRMHVRAHGPKNVNVRKRERTGYDGRVAKN